MVRFREEAGAHWSNAPSRREWWLDWHYYLLLQMARCIELHILLLCYPCSLTSPRIVTFPINGGSNQHHIKPLDRILRSCLAELVLDIGIGLDTSKNLQCLRMPESLRADMTTRRGKLSPLKEAQFACGNPWFIRSVVLQTSFYGIWEIAFFSQITCAFQKGTISLLTQWTPFVSKIGEREVRKDVEFLMRTWVEEIIPVESCCFG